MPLSQMTDIRINGWSIFLHPCFLDQYEALLAEVEAAKAKDPKGYRKRTSTKLLTAVHRLAFEIIPSDPTHPDCRMGNTLGGDYRHWFRAKFFQQYRLFFRYQESARIIVIAWVNDETTRRAYGAKSDAYAVFRKMLSRGRPPDDWNGLLAESRSSRSRAGKVRSDAEGSI